MAEVHGICALCQENRPLKDSHFLPQALYRLVRFGNSAKQVFTVTGYGSWKTDKQMAQALLCGECEQRFHRNGEDWVLRHVYRGTDVFRLLSALDSLTPFQRTQTAKVYAVDGVRGIDRSQLTYFAMSVFWRGAVSKWKLSGHALNEINFGPDYTKALQLYLLAKQPFPNNFALNIEVCDKAVPAAMLFITPSGTNNGKGFRSYSFMVPGIAFHLYVGQRIPLDIQDGCMGCGKTPLIVRMAVEQFLDFKRIKNLRRHLLGLDA